MPIFHTLSYFSLFSRPLTRREFVRARWHQDTSATNSIHRHLLALSHDDIREYHRHIVHTDQRISTAARAARILCHVPFVRAIFLCNTVAMGAASASSDVDLFIVTKQGRLWFTRRSKKQVSNKICLSFYVSADGLDFSDIKITNDIYLAYWLHTLRPLYDPHNLQTKLYNTNGWAKQMISDGMRPHIASPRITAKKSKERVKRLVETLWSSLGDQLESQAKAIQQTKMKLNTMSVQHESNSNVVISDTMLKFHENDRRVYYRDAWLELCKTYAS